MTHNFKRNCMIVVAVTAVIAGLAIAVITAVRHTYPEPHVGAHALAQLAESTHGKSAAGLRRALINAKADQLRAALANGRMSKAEETARMTKLHERANAPLSRR